jgi:hypothetical protein
MRVGSEDFYAVWQSQVGDQPVGHAHFWKRALSRRRFITTALAGSAALGLPALSPAIAQAAAPVLPNPINGGTVVGPFGLKHFYFPTNPSPVGPVPNFVSNGSGDASTIRDFRGTVGLAEFPPTGVVTDDPFKGAFWAADLRFMQGSFIGRDNHKHRGTFAFI